MLIPNLLKSQSPISRDGVGNQLPTFDVESISAKIPKSKSPILGGVGGGVMNQLPIIETESKSTEIPKSLFRWGGEVKGQFPTFDADLLKSKKKLQEVFVNIF